MRLAAPCEAGRLREADARPVPAKAWKGGNSVSAFRMVAAFRWVWGREVMEKSCFSVEKTHVPKKI